MALDVNPGAGMFFALERLSDRALIAGGLVIVISSRIQTNDINYVTALYAIKLCTVKVM